MIWDVFCFIHSEIINDWCPVKTAPLPPEGGSGSLMIWDVFFVTSIINFYLLMPVKKIPDG
jgi:hypothetical protein